MSPFYCRAADVYARMYIAVYTKVKAAHGASVRIGAALGIDQFSLDVLSYLQGNGTSIDFLDHHSYPNTPSAVPYQVHARPGGMNLQDMLGSHGFSRLTPISIGEWSRSIGLDYAQDGPGAAFVGCGLIYLNGLTYANSGGLHNVERGYLYSAEKIWDGSKPDAPDRNAATVINWWSRMVGGTHLRTTGSKLPSSSGDDEVCVLASIDGTSSEILAMVAHYKPAAQRNAAPTTLPCGPLRLSLSGVPWAEWTWTQYANHGPSVLNAVAWGTGSGASATLNLSMHGNSYSTLRVARLQSGAAPEGAPAEGSGMRANKYPATPAVTAAQQATIERAQCAPLPPPAPPSRPAAAGLQAAAYAGIGAGAAGAALALWLGVRWVRRRGAQRPGGANALQIYEQDQKP